MHHNRNWTLCRLGPRRGISSSQDHRTRRTRGLVSFEQRSQPDFNVTRLFGFLHLTIELNQPPQDPGRIFASAHTHAGSWRGRLNTSQDCWPPAPARRGRCSTVLR